MELWKQEILLEPINSELKKIQKIMYKKMKIEKNRCIYKNEGKNN
jgi:hypothetical protein